MTYWIGHYLGHAPSCTCDCCKCDAQLAELERKVAKLERSVKYYRAKIRRARHDRPRVAWRSKQKHRGA